MVMVVHETIGVAQPVIALIRVLEGVQKVDPVLVALEDYLLFIASGGDMIDSACVLYS
jgi:hypothetical protein